MAKADASLNIRLFMVVSEKIVCNGLFLHEEGACRHSVRVLLVV